MREEWKRIFGRPFIYMLFVGCMVVNIWVIWNFSGQRSLVAASSKAAESFSEDGSLLQVSEENSRSIAQFITENAPEGDTETNITGIPTILQMLAGVDPMADSLGPKDIAESYISAMEFTGGASDMVRKIFSQLVSVMNQNRENGVSRAFFVPCNKNFFELFSGNLLPFLMVECIVCAVLLMINTANDPFSAKLTGLIYTCRKGRKLQTVKWVSGLIAGVGFTVALWGVTIGIAALVFPLGSLWQTPIGSMMVLDKFYPVIPWFSMTVISYIGVQLLIALSCVCLFSMAAYALVLRLHQSFPSVMILGFISALIYTVTWCFPKDTAFYFTMQWNPVDLARKAGHWLVNGSSFISPRFYEIGTFGLWAAVLAAVIILVTRRFYKEDL